MKLTGKIYITFGFLSFAFLISIYTQNNRPNLVLTWTDSIEVHKILLEKLLPKKDANSVQSSFECQPIRTFGFIKNHKCGTMALTTMFLRVAKENSLEILLPKNSDWNLDWPRPPQNFLPSRKESGKFDVQVLHTMYDKKSWDELLEPGYKRISIIRYPWKQFKSYFSFFNMANKMTYFTRNTSQTSVELLEKFLRHPIEYVRIAYTQSRNVQAFNFGYTPSWREPPNPKKEDQFLQELAREMDLVLVTDYFYHSMILLKEEMCWSLYDVIIGLKNENKHPFFYDELKHINEEPLEYLYRQWATLDYKMYNLFNQSFWRKVNKIEKIEQKVESYSKVIKAVYNFCSKKQRRKSFTNQSDESKKVFSVNSESNYWKETFSISRDFCHILDLETKYYVNALKEERY